jgi:hypothetical protein
MEAIRASGGKIEDVYIEDAVHGQQETWRYAG